MKQRQKSGFIITLDGKSLYLVIILAVLSAAVIFYLGVIFGKADRDPNIDRQPARTKIEKGDSPDISVKKLEIFNIRDNDRSRAAKSSKTAKPSKTDLKNTSEMFTVQVFSTGNPEKANKLKTALTEEGFDAYLSKFSIYGKKLHRVRVGKVLKSETLSLKERLKKSQTLKNTEMEFRVFKIQ